MNNIRDILSSSISPSLLALRVFFIAILFGLTGCVAVVAGSAGAGAATYLAGSLKSNIGSNIDQVWAASRAAASDLRFTIDSEKQDATVGQLKARNAADTAISIDLKAQNPNSTEVTIRVGLIGDQDASVMILDRIKANL